jgi:hypothetical protein
MIVWKVTNGTGVFGVDRGNEAFRRLLYVIFITYNGVAFSGFDLRMHFRNFEPDFGSAVRY